jgi:hypothetical protein
MRTLALRAWRHKPSGEDDGPAEIRGLHYPVVALTRNLQNPDQFVAVVCVGGRLLSSAELGRGMDSLVEVVVCNWPEHLDQQMLGRRLERLCRRLGRKTTKKTTREPAPDEPWGQIFDPDDEPES